MVSVCVHLLMVVGFLCLDYFCMLILEITNGNATQTVKKKFFLALQLCSFTKYIPIFNSPS